MPRLALTEEGFERMVEAIEACAVEHGGCDDCPDIVGCRDGLWDVIVSITKETRDGKETYFIDR